MMFKFPTIVSNGITARIISNTEAKSIIQFSSNRVSSLMTFIKNVKPLISYVIPILRDQQPHNIVFRVTPSLLFEGRKMELPYNTSLYNFDVDEVLEKLKFHSLNNDGGYFFLEIINPKIHVPDHLRLLAQNYYLNVLSDSGNETSESE